MCVALLVGFPEKLTRQIKAALNGEVTPGWKIKYFPGRNRDKAEIDRRDLVGICQKAADADGAHVIGFHQVGNGAEIAREIRTYFRFRRGDCNLLWSVAHGAEQFREHIEKSLIEELEWREHIRPLNKSSPLILPQYVFTPLPGYETLWGDIEMFNRENQYFQNLAKRIHRFSADHTKVYKPNHPSFMVDRTGLVWKDAGPYHAKSNFPLDWKYSHRLDSGFHFDVEHQQSKAFELTDIRGAKHSAKAGAHVNIDSHGYRSHG